MAQLIEVSSNKSYFKKLVQVFLLIKSKHVFLFKKTHQSPHRSTIVELSFWNNLHKTGFHVNLQLAFDFSTKVSFEEKENVKTKTVI